MLKRMLTIVMCALLIVSVVPAFSLAGLVTAASDNKVVMPSNNGLTNNTSYTLGAGTDAEVTVTCDFRSSGTAPTGSITPKYVTIHNTGTYVSTANAYNTHRNTAKVSGDMAWHYTVDDVSIYQALQDNRKGWHIGNVDKNPNPTNSNSNSIGIEMCVHNFPATETFDGEQWTDGTAIMKWYEDQFDQTMKNTAYLALVLCNRWGLNWRTDIKMHYDALNYYPGGKDCPMQMRATYDPVTNTFKEAGGYVDGRNGYFWQIFWSYVEAYASGATKVGDVSTAEKLGTYRVTPTDGLNVRSGPSSTYDKVTALECNTLVKVTEFSGAWGKITLDDGTEGWCNITDYGEYIGIDALAYDVGVNSDAVAASFDATGSLTLTNNSNKQGQYDLFMPLAIGTATTPYLSWKVTSLEGDGFYFGLTQKDSGYFMMLDSANSLKEGTTSTYRTGAHTGEIPLAEYWKPADGQRIDQMRFYLAPNSSIRIDYNYFAVTSGKVIDPRYNLMAADNVINLMDPAGIRIGDMSKPGSYKYSNGMLTVTADTAAGFDVVFDLNETFDVTELKRFLIGVETHTDFNIAFLVTHASGEGWVTLVDDYYPNFGETKPQNGYIPAWTGTAGLDLYNYYYYNGFIPADNMSTVKQMKISLGSAGTSYFNAVQLASNDRIKTVRDGITKEGDTYATDKVVFESEVYTVRDDNIVSGVVLGIDVATMLANVKSDYTVTVYENGTVAETTAVAKTGQVITITDGETALASYTVAVIGDVNGDGEKNTSDARVILGSLTGDALQGVQAVAADLEGTGSVDSSSARLILTALIV